MFRRSLMALGTVAALTLVGSSTAVQAQERQQAAAILHAQDGSAVGVVSFTQSGDHVLVVAQASGLPAGFHAFHVHSVGTCTGDFTSAAGHLAESGQTHPSHDGDMPSLIVNADGMTELRFETDRYRVADLFDVDGSAVIVHVGADDYANIPTRYAPEPDAATLATGDAGGRWACGVVE